MWLEVKVVELIRKDEVMDHDVPVVFLYLVGKSLLEAGVDVVVRACELLCVVDKFDFLSFFPFFKSVDDWLIFEADL